MPRGRNRRPNQAVRTTSAEVHGERTRQEQSQRIQPLPNIQSGAAPTEAGGGVTIPPPLDSPTARPGEPITSGLPIGPGAGPEAFGELGQAPDPVRILGAIYERHPNEDLRRLIEFMVTR